LGWVERLALNIEYRPLSNLRPYANTARTHTQKQVERIAASIRQFGFVNPILADEKGEIVAGHGRLAAAELLGCEIASKADPGGNGMKLLNI
jgi:ParB-like chromosome segregation protein Spo0J